MANEPFIDPQSRPDLTVDLNAKVGDLSVRQLSDILGTSAAPKLKQFVKDGIKEIEKIQKEQPDKFPVKEHKEQKDTKDHKEAKDHKDTKDNKEHKETKDTKDNKEHKEGKDHKDVKDHIKEIVKDHKEIIKEIHKEQIKEFKELEKPQKDVGKESVKEVKEVGEGGVFGDPGDPVFTSPQGIDQLIQRISGLEQQVAALSGNTTEGGGG